MRSFTQFSKGLLATGMLAASLVGIGGCGPDYSLFKVTVTSSTSPRDDIYECLMTVKDENGNLVLDRYRLKAIYGGAGEHLVQGCEAGLTNTNGTIGTLSYSSSRTSGTLTFQVDAFDNSNGGHKVVQTGASDAKQPKVYNGGANDEVPVTIVIK
jgi:hypothetical protein